MKPWHYTDSCAAGNGDDNYCEDELACAQYGSNDYKCCADSTTPFGAVSEYCTGVKPGFACEYDSQCTTEECARTTKDGNYRCVEKSCYCDLWDTGCTDFRWYDASKFPDLC